MTWKRKSWPELWEEDSMTWDDFKEEYLSD